MVEDVGWADVVVVVVAAVGGGGVGVDEADGDGVWGFDVVNVRGVRVDGVVFPDVETLLSLLDSESSPVCRCSHAFFR